MNNNENELEIGGFSANIPNENATNNNEFLNQNPVNFNTASNMFMYSDINSTPVESNVTSNSFSYVDNSMSATEIPNVENAFAYTDTPTEAVIPVMDKVEDQFSYTDLKDMPQNNVEETPKYNPPTQQNRTNNYNGDNLNEVKSNFGFMIIFALIMIAIIIALPYISGYN